MARTNKNPTMYLIESDGVILLPINAYACPPEVLLKALLRHNLIADVVPGYVEITPKRGQILALEETPAAPYYTAYEEGDSRVLVRRRLPCLNPHRGTELELVWDRPKTSKDTTINHLNSWAMNILESKGVYDHPDTTRYGEWLDAQGPKKPGNGVEVLIAYRVGRRKVVAKDLAVWDEGIAEETIGPVWLSTTRAEVYRPKDVVSYMHVPKHPTEIPTK